MAVLSTWRSPLSRGSLPSGDLMQLLPNWVIILQALAIPAIALGGLILAGLSWRTAERKRKNDLFDRRYEFYRRAERAYLVCHQTGGIHDTLGDPDTFTRLAEEARFLFGLQIARHVFESETWRDVPDQVKHGIADERFVKPFDRYLLLK